MAHLYKSRLQNYAHKRGIPLPTYSCETEGPPHARLFKAKVTIDGVTYEGPEYCTTLKDAEHSAAKVAFMSLAPTEMQEDDGLYKSLLQELTQKKGLCLPVYATQRTGPSHMPTFMTLVEVAGETFTGQEARSKKQAEMNAAKVAYNAIMEGGSRMNSKAVFSDIQKVGASNVVSPTSRSQPAVRKEQNGNIKMQTIVKGEAGNSVAKEAANQKGEAEENDIPTSQPTLIHENRPNGTSNVVDAAQLNIRREILLVHAQGHEDAGPDSSSKRNGSSLPNYGSSNSTVAPNADKPRGTKIAVRPHEPGMAFIGPVQCADEEWVAMSVRREG